MSNLRHGRSKTPLYRVWRAMRSRCENENVSAYPRYGGRGITICERWKKFENFLADMGSPPRGYTLERVDNNKGYSPENCIWADLSTQSRNRRDRRPLTALGKTMLLCEWSEETGISVAALWARLEKYGWTPDDAVSIPLITRRKGIPKGEKLRRYA